MGLLFILGLAANKASASNVSPINLNLKDATITQWEPFVKIAAVVAQVPWQFANAWLAIESGGNACAVGNKTTVVPPANFPREIGLWQIYNPDDFKALGVNPSELCAYCVRPLPGQPNPQKLLRQMTSAEIGRVMGVGMKLINLKRKDAEHYMTLAGVKWPDTSPDFWRMVKLPHALPSILNTGLGQVVKKLGRPPNNWAEFRSVYGTINPRSLIKTDGYFRAMQNAEWTGGQVPDTTPGTVDV